MMDRAEAKRIIEALLFTSEKPIAIDQIKEVLDEIDSKDIRAIILELKSEYETLGRSFKVYEVAGGFQMVTEPAFAEYLKRFYKAKSKDKLTKPALETLAIIAYRQPITRADIEDIRGVNVDGVVNTLSDRLLIRVTGRKDAPGRPILYGTTKEFLERFGLSSLSELPKLSEFTEADIDLKEAEDGTGTVAQEDRPAGLDDNTVAQPESPAEPSDRPGEGKE
jgi:segregation and condensation protein B